LLWSLALNRIHGLQNSIFTTPAFVLVVFGLTELMGYSGAIASLALGITLGNTHRIPAGLLRVVPLHFALLSDTERTVFAEVVFLLKTFFLIFIGLSLHFSGWLGLAGGLGLTLVLFIARIPVVHLSLSRKTTPRRDAMACTLMLPKGLAAAVVATIPVQMGLPGGELIRNTTYAVVFLSILFTSGLILSFERGWLNNLARRLYPGYSEENASSTIDSEATRPPAEPS
jgi:NhaP-type Na+/H+ or K+/H+ antiporter